MNDKKYVGSGKSSNEFFTNITIEVSSTDFNEAVYEFNGKRYVNLTVGKKKEKDQYGKTHYVCINEYNPDNEQHAKAMERGQDIEQELSKGLDSDLPF